MDDKLTTLQSFNVMSEFLDMYFLQNRSSDLGTILSSMSFLSDGTTADTAMWGMWIESIDNVCKKQNLKNDGTLTNFQSFVAMMEFLDLYFGSQSYGDVEDFIRDIKLVIAHPLVPTITWGNWLKAIKVTLSFEVYKNNLVLFKDSK